MYIDTHAHLYLEQFDEDRNEVIQSARDQGIDKIFMPNVDLSTIEAMHEVARDYPSVCFPMMGLHPCSVHQEFEKDLQEIEAYFTKQKYIAVGEIGIDLYWDKSYYQQQIEAFKIQVQWAMSRRLPIVIHSRESIDEILDILEGLALPDLQGVFHCFTGDKTQAARIRDLGFYLGIGGVVTFKNGGLDKSLSAPDLKHVILETDAPYLTPHPYRGKRNESAYIPLIAEKLAQILHVSESELGIQTTENALRLFTLATNQN
ncbi:MAG: TatD family hydrolase [Saprospiraceae bacterium]|nr:TatD family hydrolase [Saprospiraceae bacterium]